VTSRRFLLRMGIASPLMLGVGNSLVGRALGQVTRRRLAFIFVHGEAAPMTADLGYLPGGIAPGNTAEDRSNLAWPSLLAPLAPLRQKMVIVDGLKLSASNDNNIHGWKRGLLAATGKAESPTHQTFDQYLAGTMGKSAAVRSLLFGGQGGGWAESNTSTFVAGPGLDARHVGDPQLLLNQLVGNAGTAASTGTSPVVYRARLLDVLRDDVRKLERGLAGEEKAPLDRYLAAMEEFGKQEEALARGAGTCGFPATAEKSGDNTVRLTSMMRIATLAMRCGVTNVVGATVGNSGIHEDMRGFGGPWGAYLGHPPNPPGSPPGYALWLNRFSQFSMGLVAEMIAALGPLANDLVAAVIPAGGVCNNTGEGFQHHGTSRAVAYVYDGTGQMKTGARYYRPGRDQGRDMADLYTTLAGVLGAPIDRFNGVGTGPLRDLLA
jgi:hypothetical protein